ncbi:DNA cytosine methyltransferase [Flavobacterium foetidum]|uniref:DNA cytosine methyltransferase n=1 Tax=Flavobacterium foetidum TaxID=2026681 RepID=UPI001075803B|nr:DNA cytosine methyltransferase [Flavobacterium foetidum]KAF2509113.1 DNA cytosine methyltransferase [Flavobacterium foetidum]
MISTKTIQYKLPKESLMLVQEPQIRLFEDEFKISTKKEFIGIDFNQRGYTVNDKVDLIIDSKIQTIGFFSGAGGLDIGSQLAGAKVISSLDFDRDSVATMKANKYFAHSAHFHKDIKEMYAKDYNKIIKANNPEKLILVGGPPCQPFSKAGYWVTHKNRLGSEDPRNMIGQYLRIVEELQPDGFLLENVESLLHPKNAQAVTDLKEAIDKLGYKFIVYRADALDFGVPQKRKRVFFIASRKGILGEPIKTHGDELEILVNKNLLPHERVIDWIGKFDSDKYFEAEELTTGKTYDEELKQIPPGQNYFALTERSGHPNPKFEANKRFWNFLLKLHPNQPSWTIAAQPGPWVGPFHWNNRRLRVPESAAIQTFPEDYHFVGTRRSIQKQIGNAVPSLLGKAIVKHLISNI